MSTNISNLRTVEKNNFQKEQVQCAPLYLSPSKSSPYIYYYYLFINMVFSWLNGSQCQKGRQHWQPNLPEGKYRVYARMIEFMHSDQAYQDIDAANSNWDIKSIYVLCDAYYIREVHGKIRLDS